MGTELDGGDTAGNIVVPVEKSEPEAAWKTAIEKVVDSVVSIHWSEPFSFDTGLSGTSQATGFVIDAERGYVLTNRHVVSAGPFWGHIIFHNHEEVDAYALYRDPVHDFGILRFDPKAIKYMDVVALDLQPDLAQVGVEIKVIGNDGGETLGILSGFISRTDRNAPEYGAGYRDFNTCYYQANAAATGGSSGSPVVNISGQAIAMQAGGRSDGASTDYFLPLDGPLRALRQIQRGENPVRGDVQCRFSLTRFDECRRLGLSSHWEAHVREAQPEQTSMLVARTIVPGGWADEKIREGDILIKVDGQLITDFLLLGNIMDASVGKTLRLLLQRGGSDVEEDVMVGDLEEISPKRLLHVAGASFHDLSYQVTQLYVIPRKGVYVNEAGLFRMGDSRRGWIIERVATKETPNLDAFIEVLKTVPDRARIVVSFKYLSDLDTTHTQVVTINRHWRSKMKMLTRNDTTGVWDFEVIADALPPELAVPCKASFAMPKDIQYSAVSDAIRSFVQITAVLPFYLDGVDQVKFLGMGLVIDAEKGLVIVSRALIPHRFCEVQITIANSISVWGKVIFLHPYHNYTIIQYDPSLVDAPVQTANLSTKQIRQGQNTIFVGYTETAELVYASTPVTRLYQMKAIPNSTPRYRPVNMTSISIESRLGSQCSSGAMMTEDGQVEAIWLHWDDDDVEAHYGISSIALASVITRIRNGDVPSLRILPVEFETVSMFQAREMGVSAEWITQIEQKEAPHELYIAKRVFGDQDPQLLESDIVLTLNGELITQSTQLDVTYWHDFIDAEIVRNGEQMNLRLQTLADEDMETTHFVNIAGVGMQKPHLAVRQQVKKLPSEVYMSGWFYGSPAALYNLAPGNFVTHINDVETNSLDDVLAVERQIPDNTYFRVRVVSTRGIPSVITIKKNELYYPTVEFLKDASVPSGFRRRTWENGKMIDGEGVNGLDP